MTEPSPDEARWELEPRGCFIALTPGGLRLGLRRRGLETSFVPVEELTHVEATGFGVWIATKKTTQVIRRSHFVRDRDAEDLVQVVRQRIAEQPGGEAQLERMRRVAATAMRPQPRRVSTSLVALCVAVFALQWIDPFSMEVGAFYPELVKLGEWWRIATGNLLHARSIIPLHLVINMLCLLAFGVLVERVLGAPRTFLVVAASGLTAMLASALAGYTEVLGASGVVAGLVGAVLWLEFHESERLPAWWRIPRRLLISAVLLQAVLDQLVPFIAAAAHLGGLAGGYLVMPFAARGGLEGQSPTRGQRIAAILTAVAVAMSLLSAGRLVLREPSAMASYGRDLLAWPRVSPIGFNALAWRMVTESEPGTDELQVAIELAERAVEQTGRHDPNILDTLAEVLFVAGDESAALAVIDEAILLAGDEIYFREQRRRFTGERDADDRPDPPTHWIVPAPELEQVFPPRERGISI